MARRGWFVALILLFALTITGKTFAADPAPKGKISILVAASLADLFKKMKTEFEAQYPGTEILIEPGGSLSLIRKVSDLNAEADVIIVADRELIPTHLVPKHADRSIDFLSERIAIVVGKDAKHADEINSQNWMEVLNRPGVEYGISNPETAPVGYRALMVWKLAEKHYNKPGLYQRFRDKLPAKNIRPNATALMALLAAGEIDYVFDYPTLAKQQGMRVVELPAEIHLGDPRFAANYATVSVEIPGTDPGTKKEMKGAPIVYSIAPLKAARNPTAAAAFVDFVLKEQGRAVIARAGMTLLEVK